MKRKEDLLKKVYHLSHSLLIKSRECSSILALMRTTHPS